MPNTLHTSRYFHSIQNALNFESKEELDYLADGRNYNFNKFESH